MASNAKWKMQGQIGFLRDPEFLQAEAGSAILSCINHRHWFEQNSETVLKRSSEWLKFLDLVEARDRGYDMEVPLLEGDDEIVKRDVDRTFATAKYRDVLHILLYKCKKKFGDYQQSLSYMGGFLLLFFDMGTAYKVLTILNADPKYLCNYWRAEAIQCNIDGWVLFDVLPQYLPKLSESFTNSMTHPNIIALSQKWFGGVFIQNLPCPFLIDVMHGFFRDGIKHIFRISLCLLRELEPFFYNQPLNKQQEVVRLLNKGTRKVTREHMEHALSFAEDPALDELLAFDLEEYRHDAFRNHLQKLLCTANYKECLMPLEYDDFSDDEEEILEDGVATLQKCIQTKRLKKEYLATMFDRILNSST